jgi:class 3 adenylate cyclase/tetratricopeptide (TPR) repeat protein
MCTQCGYENLAEDKFCGECGHALVDLEADHPIDYSQPQSYTPKTLADKIMTMRDYIEGERKLVTVLFTDVVNYTSIAEKLDPEEVHRMMDGCFKILMDQIHRYEGTIDKFTGDGVMALFGAPVAHEDHAQRACYAALDIQAAIVKYSEIIQQECGVDIKVRVGLHSGPVIVGSIGNDLRMDYTAIGDTTNLASRMESVAKQGTILVSADTHRMARDFFKFGPQGKIKVKGKNEALEVYELIEAGEVETRIEASTRKGLTRFVGRKKEIESLKEAFEKAQSGSGQVIGIVGEAGVGKSRLLLELRGILPAGAYTYIESECLHYGVSMAYLPLLDILRNYFNIKEGEREFVIKKRIAEKICQFDGKLKDTLPPLYELLSLTVEDDEYLHLEPSQKRERIFEAMRNLLIHESAHRPLVLALENIHWIDRTSEEFLDYLVGWLAHARIMLVLLYRPEYTHQWGSKSYYGQIGVDHLPASTSAELVQAILREGEVEPGLRDLIVVRAGGNPLFMEEFAHTLMENGSIQKKDNEYLLTIKASEIQIPDTIQGIIAARMDRLEDNLKSTIQVASVIGRDFTYRILQTITGMREELKAYLLNLQSLEFIYEKNLFPELEYVFKHALTQEVAYNSLLLKRRKDIHEKIGKAIETLYPDRLEEFYEMLAHHYLRSKNLEKAYQYLKLSGDKALQHYSNWESLYFLREAIGILNKLPDTEENKRRMIEISLLMEGPMKILAYPEDTLQLLHNGERLSIELGDERSLAIFYSNIGLAYAFKGNSIEGIAYAEKCFNTAEKIEDLELIAPTAFNLCSSYAITGEYVKTVQVAPRVLVLLEKTNRESDVSGVAFNFNLYSALSAYYGNAMGALGNFKEGEALCEKALRFACDIDNLYSMGFAEGMFGLLFIFNGDGEKAVEHLWKSIKYAEEGQIVPLLALSWTYLGQGHYFMGDLQNAKKFIEKGIKLKRDSELSFLLSQQYWALAMVLFESGELESARSYSTEALKLAQSNNEKHIEGPLRILLGRIMAKTERSQYSKAEDSILQGIRLLDEWNLKPFMFPGYLHLGELYADIGQKEKAIKNLKKAETAFQEMGMDYWLSRTQAVMEKL